MSSPVPRPAAWSKPARWPPTRIGTKRSTCYRELVADDDRPRRRARRRPLCQPAHVLPSQLARLPAEGLAAYRRRVDPLAEQWYREALPTATRRSSAAWSTNCFAAVGATMHSWRSANWRWSGATSGRPPLLGTNQPAAARSERPAAVARASRHRLDMRTGRKSSAAGRSHEAADVARVSRHAARFGRRACPPDSRLDPRGSNLTGPRWNSTCFVACIRRPSGRLAGRRAVCRRAGTTAYRPRANGRPNRATGIGRRSPARKRDHLPQRHLDHSPVQLGTNRSAVAAPKLVAPDRESSAVDLSMAARDQRTDRRSTVRESERPLSCFPVVVDGVVVFGDATAVRAVESSDGQSRQSRPTAFCFATKSIE